MSGPSEGKRRACAVAYGREVREARKAAGMDQREAAAHVELSRRQIQLIEAGESYPAGCTRDGILSRLRACAAAGGDVAPPTVGKPADSPA